MNLKKSHDLKAFCWVAGCAIPVNASSIIKYLFENESNRPKPQFEASLMNGQIYAAAFSNIFNLEKKRCSSYSAIVEQLRFKSGNCLSEIKRLCNDLEELKMKHEFSKAAHVALIECLMRLSIANLASPASLNEEVQRLVEVHPQAGSVIMSSGPPFVEVHSTDFVGSYSRCIYSWLLIVAWIVVPELLQDKQALDHASLIQGLSLISLLSCAAYYYRFRIEKIIPSGSRTILHKAPCLNAQLAAMFTENEPMRRDASLEDDQSNVTRLQTMLEGILEEKKTSGGKHNPSHVCLIAAAVCTLPHFVGDLATPDFELSALCSTAALFHWFTGAEWPRVASDQIVSDDPQLGSKKAAFASDTVLRNSIALHSLVQSSGGLAKKARPANPEKIPAALVDLRTVEQLVSSTTSEPSEQQQVQDGFLSELACTAALAVVGSPEGSNDAGKIKVFPRSSLPNPRLMAAERDNMNAFFLNKNFGTDNGNSIYHFPASIPLETNSPNTNLVDSSTHQIGGASFANSSEIAQKPASPSYGAVSIQGISKSQNCRQKEGQTNWKERARHGEEKRSQSVSTVPAETGRGSAALRLLLDHQRRVIEANHQRAMHHGDKVAAHRNQAAFRTLLHSSQKRRHHPANDKSSSLPEEEEIEALHTCNGEFNVNQGGLPPKEFAEEEYVDKEQSEQNSLNSPGLAVESADIEDISSTCAPDQAETLFNTESQIHNIDSSSPSVESPRTEDMSTPRINRRHSPCSTSSSSPPEDDTDFEANRSALRRHYHHRANYEQYSQSAQKPHRFDSHSSQCSQCNTQSCYHSMPRRRHIEQMQASGDGIVLKGNVNYDQFYGTVPTRRVSKSPRGVRKQRYSAKHRCRDSELSPKDLVCGDNGHFNETASEICCTTHAGRRRPPSHQRLRQRQIDLDEEYSCFGCSPTSAPRPSRLKLNHLGKSAGTGLDALVVAELARSVTSLRSDIERLTAQQLSLRGDYNDANPMGSVAVPVGSAHSSSRLHLSITPSSSTRAMWSTRTPLRYSSQCDVQTDQGAHKMADSPDRLIDGTESPKHTFPSDLEIGRLKLTSPPDSKSIDDHTETATKSTSPEPEVIKPAEKLFIAFENSTSERLQRARERLEARRAADRERLGEIALQARMADREAQLMAEISEMTKSAPRFLDESFTSSDMEPDNSGFPVHTTNGDGIADNEENGSEAATTPGSTSSSTARPRRPYAERRKTFAGEIDGGGSSRTSRSSSVSRPTVRSSVTSSIANRNHTASTSRMNARSIGRQGSLSRRSTERLSDGPSLSSLHRLENGDESSYSGPGVPFAGIQPQPRLYVKPKSKSNRQVIVNAISHCCLAGTVNEPAKKLALKELAAVDGSHFMVLFRDGRCQYRGLYIFDSDTEEIKLICGNGPRKITHNMCEKFFKYNSGAKQFIEITSTKHLSAVVDAITIENCWWVRPPSLHSNTASATTTTAPLVSGSSKS